MLDLLFRSAILASLTFRKEAIFFSKLSFSSRESGTCTMGRSSTFFRERSMRPLSSILMTLALTFCCRERTSSTFLTKLKDSSEMWIIPRFPDSVRLTNAP